MPSEFERLTENLISMFDFTWWARGRVLAMMEEAAKEFPMLDSVFWQAKNAAYIKSIARKSNYAYLILKKLSDDREEWLKKWFGDLAKI
jgi:hypothetical protein